MKVGGGCTKSLLSDQIGKLLTDQINFSFRHLLKGGLFRIVLFEQAPGHRLDISSLSVRERTGSCATSAFRNDFLSRRATDRKDELLDGLSKTVFAVATGYKIRRPLHFGAGIAHCNTETAALKHRDVIVTVADGNDLRQRNL
jgi:hypothetical protein